MSFVQNNTTVIIHRAREFCDNEFLYAVAGMAVTMQWSDREVLVHALTYTADNTRDILFSTVANSDTLFLSNLHSTLLKSSSTSYPSPLINQVRK